MILSACESVTVNGCCAWKEAGVGVYIRRQNAARPHCSLDRGERNGQDLQGGGLSPTSHKVSQFTTNLSIGTPDRSNSVRQSFSAR